eukprot:COSAG06_NODE_4030_length_4642_cov_26.582435_2_plen_73_part_00
MSPCATCGIYIFVYQARPVRRGKAAKIMDLISSQVNDAYYPSSMLETRGSDDDDDDDGDGDECEVTRGGVRT